MAFQKAFPKYEKNSLKFNFEASKIDPRGIQNRARSRPRRRLYKTFNLGQLLEGNPEEASKFFQANMAQFWRRFGARDPPKSRPKPQKIDVENQYVFGIDF